MSGLIRQLIPNRGDMERIKLGAMLGIGLVAGAGVAFAIENFVKKQYPAWPFYAESNWGNTINAIPYPRAFMGMRFSS